MKTLNKESDLYPTRGKEEEIFERKSPVIFNDPSSFSKSEAEQLIEFKQNGYLILHEVFNEEEIAEVRKELERLKDTAANENFVY
ncbi:MAG: hypothetical protein NE328_11700 [Lentisphaeraceae bacterium]|nr:hypothetical protein [Lentisphaeraceae bacterium]